MNIRKTKPWRLSIIFYQRSRHLTHSLSIPRGSPARVSRRERPNKIVAQTIIKKYIEQKNEACAPNVSQFLCLMRSSRIQKELDNSTNRSINTRLGAEYRYYRSKPSLALHMTREITRRLICYNPQRAPAHTAEETKTRHPQGHEEQGEKEEKIKIVREEFTMTPQLLQIISERVATRIFRSIELERLRSGL